MPILYAGPGKLYMNNQALWPEGDQARLEAEVRQGQVEVASGFFGRVASLQGNAEVQIRLTPFENWSALAIGTRPHGATDVPCQLWSPDGRLYTFGRAAVLRHPELRLGLHQGLFGPVEISAIVASGKKLGDAAALYTIVESAGADPGGQQGTDYTRGAWTGVWGTAAGFGGGTGDSPIEAEEQWVIENRVKYSPLVVQQLVRGYQLESVAFLARVRPYGPSHSQIDAALGLNAGRTLGAQFAGTSTAADLVLSGPNGKIITLKNADVVGAGFEFGGTRLGTGELGFVTSLRFTSGAPQPLLTFN